VDRACKEILNDHGISGINMAQDEDDIGEIRRLNVVALVERYGSQRQLAKSMGVSGGYVYQIVKGIRNLGERSSKKFEGRLNLPEGWLSELPDNQETNIKKPPAPPRQIVPVITWEDAPMGQERPKSAITAAWDCGTTCYALEVESDAMCPEIPVGAVVTVSPNHKPQHGDIIVYRGVNGGSATMRHYLIDGGEVYLKSANNLYPLLPLTDQTILGTVMFFQKRLIKGT